MKHLIMKTASIAAVLSMILFAVHGVEGGSKPVRVAVIGGMTMTPLWNEIDRRFQKETGIKTEVVVTGAKPILARAMQEGRVDFLTMHSSDATTSLVADGWAIDLRPWAKNDLVIVGPADDPAGISGMKDGTAAVRKIAASGANWLDFQSNGPRETAHTLFHRAGVHMIGAWVLKYENTDTKGILHYVGASNAYMIVGRIPIMFNKMQPSPGVKIMVQGDPVMRRPYVAMVANPERFPSVNIEGARKLSDFLLSEKIQRFLATYDGGLGDGIPIFIPVRNFNNR